MCGICGIGIGDPGSRDLASDRQVLQAMNDSLHHRGPDGEGLYFDEGVALGHRRLSIIDLAGGDQPIFNEDGSVAIVFNGEIYNYRELRKDLEARGHIFKTHSDTEVIVHLYEDKGVDCLADLNGMFAFAIWDKRYRRLFIARDRLGEKPLYYRFADGRLVFASELKALLKDPAFKPALDLDALDDYLAYGYVPSPRCILEGVKKLPPAHYLLLENGRLQLESYWRIDFASPAAAPQSEGEALEQLKALLNDSIGLRLRSDVPVGAFLSGGIDSSLTVALAAQQSANKLSTFSVGFSEQDFNELRFAKMVADQYGTEHHEITLTDLDTALFPDIVAHFDEPFADASAIPTYYVTREAARHLKVCISGDAGDELFCGYTRYNWEALERTLDYIPPAIRRIGLDSVASILPDSFRGKGQLRRMAVSGHLRWQRKVGPFDVPERLALFRDEFKGCVDVNAWLFEKYFSDKGLDPISQRMLADQATYLPDDILVKVDRNSMWNSLEVRVPFLDHRIVEFANGLPLNLKNRDGNQKYIIKQLLKTLVPREILERPKKGFGLPLKHWLKHRFDEYARDLLLASDSRVARYLDQNTMRKLVESNSSGERDLSRRVWTLLWLEQWFRHFSL